MNTERLALIANSIQRDIDSSGILSALGGLVQAFNERINNAEAQENISTARKAVHEALDKSEFSNFPRTWASSLDELGLKDDLGESLRATIDEIIERNEITLTDARDAIQQIFSELGSSYGSLGKLVEGFEYFGIDEPDLEELEGEISFLMPGTEFDYELKGFANEVAVFDRTMRFFFELAAGSHEPPKIKRLSNPDPTLIVAATASTVWALLKVVDKIQSIRERTHNTRKLQADTEKALAETRKINAEKDKVDVETKKEEYLAEAAKNLQKASEAIIKDGLDEVREWLLSQYKIQRGQTGEMRNKASRAMEDLAVRLDHGYKIDGDVGEADATELADSEHPDKQREKDLKLIADIKDVALRIRHVEVPGSPVLQLPSPANTNNPDEQD